MKHGASDKGTKKDLSNNILKAIMEQNKDDSREERKVDANETRAGASETNAPVEAEVVAKNSKGRQRKIRTATNFRKSEPKRLVDHQEESDYHKLQARESDQ